MFLSDTELFELTGYRRNADRCRWLTDHKWTFERSAITGRPVVSKSYAEAKLSGGAVRAEPKLNTASIRG